MDNKENVSQNAFGKVYNDTEIFIDIIKDQYPLFNDVLRNLRDGNAKIELKKRFMLKAIDEVWVEKIEDCLPALDMIIRKPSKFIEEREEILPIELSRNISSRSVQHLSQHTDFISKIEGDEITPSKILNVFKEETMLTYENKFVNTLINRLYAFVARRYDTAMKEGKDEKNTKLSFSEDFNHDDIKAKINFNIEISEEPSEVEYLKNYTFTTDLWQRVVKLYLVCCEYMNSEFVKNMNKTYIRPPVIRTNAILKNKNLRQCLELWEFIESYENIGYNMLIQENLEEVDSRYIQELYTYSAIQYILFRHNIKNEFDYNNTLDSQMTDQPLSPYFVDEVKDFEISEFNKSLSKENIRMFDSRNSDLKKECSGEIIKNAVDVAINTDKAMRNKPLSKFVFPKQKLSDVMDEIKSEVGDKLKKAGQKIVDFKNTPRKHEKLISFSANIEKDDTNSIKIKISCADSKTDGKTVRKSENGNSDKTNGEI